MKKYIILIGIVFLFQLEGISQCVTSDADPRITGMSFQTSCLPIGSTTILDVNWSVDENPFNDGVTVAPAGAWGVLVSLPQTGEYEYVNGTVSSIGNTSFCWSYDSTEKALRGYSNSSVGFGSFGTISLEVLGIVDTACSTIKSNAEVIIASIFDPGCSNACPEFHNNDAGNDSVQSELGVRVVLPVALSSFTVKSNLCQVELQWTTVSEVNSQGFAIERSFIGRDFEEIAFVESKELEENGIRSYSYHDRTDDLNGVVYYRLRQMDFNGVSEIFNVESLRLDCGDDIEISLYPNPTRNFIQLSMMNPSNQSVEFSLLDMNGRDCSGRVKITAVEDDLTEFNVTALDAGMYLIIAKTHSKLIEKTFVKVD